MSFLAWLRALRPLAHANVAPPILLGQALALHAGTPVDPALFVLAHTFGLLDHAFIVLANDHADRAVDADNDTFSPFSGGSRVLPEGLLTPDAIRRAALVAAGALVALCLGAASFLARPLAPVFALAAIALLWAYSYRPLALSYRGGGEILQGIGLGAVLPLWGFYAQRGALTDFPWLALAPLVLLNIAGNVLTALPDTPSDRRGGKLTWPVRVGERTARWHALALTTLALVLLTWLQARVHGMTVALGLLTLPAFGVLSSLAWFARADATERAACTRFVLAAASAIGTAQVGWAIALFSG